MLLNSLNAKLSQEIYVTCLKAITDYQQYNPYVLFFYLDFDYDVPCKPKICLGFNTEAHFKKRFKEIGDEIEARWYIPCILSENHRSFHIFEESIFSKWLENFNFAAQDIDDEDEQEDIITHNIKIILVNVIRELHNHESLNNLEVPHLPILILEEMEECDYSEENLSMNQQANGSFLPINFIHFYNNILNN